MDAQDSQLRRVVRLYMLYWVNISVIMLLINDEGSINLYEN
jgi:hypothetical protein